MKIYSSNKKALFDYFLEKFYEAGISLIGPEVKAIRSNKVSLKETYVKIINNEVFLINCFMPLDSNSKLFHKVEEKRSIKLLLTKKEIKNLVGLVSQDGYTLVATQLYQPNDSKKIKITIALAKGKKLYDKREAIKEKDIKRDLMNTFKDFFR
jgi:SsrA-binding protein